MNVLSLALAQTARVEVHATSEATIVDLLKWITFLGLASFVLAAAVVGIWLLVRAAWRRGSAPAQ